MASIRQIVDELRNRGVTVYEWDGWNGRGNSDGGSGPAVRYIDVRGAVIHHTASPYGGCYAGLVSSTRSDLFGGALCNFAGNDDGSLTVVASGLAWHAGPGVGPSLGRVLGGIPNIQWAMNRVTAGLEIVYPGDQPMRDAQYRTATTFGKVVADLAAGGDMECVRAHFETNGNVPGGNGKWDPGYAPGRSIDMGRFRADAANSGGGGGPAPGPQPGDPNAMATLTYGMMNDDRVRHLQQFLNDCNWQPELPLLPTTGNYLDMTKGVVRQAQNQCGVGGADADGSIVGPRTKAAFYDRGARW